MKSQRPEYLKQGERARLFPTISETNRENRPTSVFLALLPYIPAFSADLLLPIGIRIGQRSRIECWTEVVPCSSSHLDKRPDGLIVVKAGQRIWKALVEAKIRNNQINEEQVKNYLEAAKECGIDAVITISNQFVARPEFAPVNVPKTLLRRVKLYHWSWTYIRTHCEILHRDMTDNPEQAFLLDEFLRLLEHKDSGVQRFSQMNPGWKQLVQTVTNQGSLSKNDPDTIDCIGSWHQEERDLSLQLSRHVGAKVQTVMARKSIGDSEIRLKDDISKLVNDNVLYAAFRIPNCASDLEITAHLMARTVTFGMKLNAPLDRKSTKARVNWLLRMLPVDDSSLILRAYWPSRSDPTDASIADLRIDGSVIQTGNPKVVPSRFEVLLIDNLGGDFLGRQKFIERIEKNITLFYDLVGQRLRAWQPPPPKPIHPPDSIESSTVEENDELH